MIERDSMHLLVTGGAGFIGSNFVRKVLTDSYPGSANHKVTVLDALTYAGSLTNLEPVKNNPNFNFVHGDILDVDLVNDLMKTVDNVVHFAAESHVDRSISGSREFIMTNVVGTHTLLEAARTNSINKFVHVSTDEVYGTISEGSWDENCSLLPNSPYSASKASSDLLVRSYARTHNLNVNITRCSNNYGIYQFPEKVIPLFITNLMDGKKVPLYGEGLNVRDWLHVDDHCRGIYLVMENGRPGEIYNIGGGTELTNKELTQLLLEASGKDWDSVEKVEDRKGHDLRYSVDISKISEELGYQPQVDFKTGLKETIDWYKNNRQWWEPLKQKI
jgi:dTDP-glucose 4,6-dehydratase